MANLILFINSFLSYLFVFVIIVVLVIIACMLGIKWKKHSDAKLIESPLESESGNAEK